MPTVLMVSREGHCLNDLLFRVSKRPAADRRARHHQQPPRLLPTGRQLQHSLPPHPVTKRRHQGAGRGAAIEIIEAEGAELVILARYMQVLSDDLCTKLAGRAINIHHSFLPSFKGAKPYYQAHDRA